ncbi:hypothetical protein AB6A40_009375 [Gnathostoma spinigerum]|uniref:Uncharacterized protein n=1 Tax=Gnathostoma spinigerum TaxID=75299 RepID=A0ABD6ETM8_9BILA
MAKLSIKNIIWKFSIIAVTLFHAIERSLSRDYEQHRDNASARPPRLIHDFVVCHGISQAGRAPSFIDLVTFNYWLFRKVVLMLGTTRLESWEDRVKDVAAQLATI